jgi:hypothetical protein
MRTVLPHAHPGSFQAPLLGAGLPWLHAAHVCGLQGMLQLGRGMPLFWQTFSPLSIYLRGPLKTHRDRAAVIDL